MTDHARIAPCSGYEASDERWQHNQAAILRLPAYDDSWLRGSSIMAAFPARPIFTIERDHEAGALSREFAAMVDGAARRIMQIHEEMLIRRVDQEIVEEVYGRPMFRLCEREIPARGTE